MIGVGREKVRRILLLLDRLKVQTNSRYAEIERRSANYEDLAYLAGQISDDLGDEYENPALQPFVRNALIELGGLFPVPEPNAAREELRKACSNCTARSVGGVGNRDVDLRKMRHRAKTPTETNVSSEPTERETRRPLYERLLENEGSRILAGTFNKILRYNAELFLELHYRFHRALQDCNTLVVCGYGFGDKGINTRIAEWRHRPSLPKLLIIDPAEPSAIVGKARGAIQREIAAIDPVTPIDSLAPGVVTHWKKGLADALITWESIRTEIDDR